MPTDSPVLEVWNKAMPTESPAQLSLVGMEQGDAYRFTSATRPWRYGTRRCLPIDQRNSALDVWNKAMPTELPV